MTWSEISSVDELVAVVGVPVSRVVDQARTRLHDLDRQWLAASPFCVLATSDANGDCDASPKGDPAGQLVHVLDDRTIAIAERPGNRRVDGYRNLLSNPHLGMVFLIPGRDDTLRINGRARLVSDAPFFDAMAVKGRRPIMAVVVEVEQVFHHCAKALLRSHLWQPETWTDPVPTRAAIVQTLESPEQSLAELVDFYGPSYADALY